MLILITVENVCCINILLVNFLRSVILKISKIIYYLYMVGNINCHLSYHNRDNVV